MKCYSCGSVKETVRLFGENFCQQCLEDPIIMDKVRHFLEMDEL